MIPVSLSIEGLYSYKNKQTIDFTSLTQAGIFGIFGKTGSGKSSILEAISYALYGRTERMNKNDKFKYNMMNLQSNSLYIDFVCISELDSCTYRCIVSAKRNKKHFEDVKTFERKCYKYKENEWIPIDEKYAGKIITGLAYEHFKRTMIIPQGHFMEFLELKTADRTAMLKDIFNLHNFDLYDATKKLFNKTDKELTLYKGNLQQIGELSTEELQTLQKELSTIEKEREEKQKEHETIKKEVDALSRVADDFVELEKNTQKLRELQSKANDFTNIEKDIHNIQYVQTHFTPLLTAERPKKTEKEYLLKKITELTQAIERDEKTYKQTYDTYLKLKTKFDLIPQQTTEIENLKHIITAKQLTKERDTIAERIEKGKKYIQEQEKNTDQLRSDISTLENTIEEKKASQGDITELSEKKAELERYKSFVAQIEIARKERIAIEQKTQEISQKIISLFAEINIPSQSVSFDFSNYIDKEKKKLLHEKEKETHAIHTLKIQEEIQFLHTHLEEGTPCPVCGSTTHPEAGKINTSTPDSSIHEQRIKEIENHITKLENHTQNLVILVHDLKQKQDKDTEVSNKMHELTIERNLNEPDEKPENIEAQFKQYSNTHKEIETLEKQIKNTRTQLEKQETDYKKFKEKIDEFIQKKSNFDTEISVHINQCSENIIKTYSDTSPEKLEQTIHSLTEEIELCKKEFTKTSEITEHIQTRIKEQQANKTLLVEQKNNREYELKKISEEIHENLFKSPFSSLDEIHTISKKVPQLIELTKKLENYKYTCSTTEKRIAELQQKLQDVSFSQKNFTDKKNAFIKIEQSLASLTEKQIHLKQKVQQYEENIAKQTEILTKIETLTNRLENIKTCSKLFTSNGFVNFISTKYLHMLCDIANERFTILTKHALKLEVEADNTFAVRDFLNNGKVRSIKTLSGGQAFQAALSLALALAEIVHLESPVASNFFFIDEGFGSQDKESLQTVFETLQSLQKNGKTVGMISHVEELKEYIPVHISVIEENGSKINTL
ncbi:MAG: SMC family ATPase [Bacteroidales bacterium]